jgi:RNA polymerase sigma-70 factor (ECF subfamily)
MRMPLHPKLFPNQASPIQGAEAFDRLYTRTHLIVFRYIFGLCGGPVEDVEDLTIETFVRAWKSRHRFRGDDSAALGWLLKIARNLVIDAYRRHAKHDPSLDIEQHSIPHSDLGPEDKTAHQEQLQILWQLLAQLPPHQREIIVLRYLLAWQVRAIAAHLDMAENTVSVNIRRILERLRRDWPES